MRAQVWGWGALSYADWMALENLLLVPSQLSKAELPWQVGLLPCTSAAALAKSTNPREGLFQLGNCMTLDRFSLHDKDLLSRRKQNLHKHFTECCFKVCIHYSSNLLHLRIIIGHLSSFLASVVHCMCPTGPANWNVLWLLQFQAPE